MALDFDIEYVEGNTTPGIDLLLKLHLQSGYEIKLPTWNRITNSVTE